jgi:tripeptide aminopeptidase
LRIEGLSGREGRVAAALRVKLRQAGCRPGWMKFDSVHRKIPGDYEIGNLIVQLPGTVKGPRLLFMGHMDTVPLCRGAVPVRRGHRIIAGGRTALGGDNRTACACLVTLAETLLTRRLPHPPITLLFNVGEEVGLWGARYVDPRDLGRPAMGFNYDSGNPDGIIIGAIGADRWRAEVFGRSAHAGMHPRDGISALLIACRAIAAVAGQGYFGRIVKGRRRGTSNAGVIRGGEATNQVTDHVEVHGESRSHDRAFVRDITQVYRRAFERAAGAARNQRGQCGRIKFRAVTDYRAFRLEAKAPVVRCAMRVARSIGLHPRAVVVDGGLDANYLNAKGIPTVTLGAGQHGAHSLNEYVDLREYWDGCRLAVALATT